MAKGVKKGDHSGEPNPEAEERRRLKKLALSRNLLSPSPAKEFTSLRPSKIARKHHGTDIVKKSQRKNRYLFSFNGLLAPITGGKIGELTNLGTKNPILYLDFKQGRMKLFGTIMYPKNGYLTLQFSKGGKNVICDEYYDTLIVFSEAWWIGKKDENPEEAKLDLPLELYQTQGTNLEYNFQGGAGAGAGIGTTGVKRRDSHKVVMKKPIESGSMDTDLEEISSDNDDKMVRSQEITPVRHSERTAGKRFKFAEVSSGEGSPDDPPASDSEISGEEEEESS